MANIILTYNDRHPFCERESVKIMVWEDRTEREEIPRKRIPQKEDLGGRIPENQVSNDPKKENRSIGFQLKAVNNMIRRKIDSMFAEEGMEDLCGMQGPLIGYIFDKSKTQDVFQRDIEKEFTTRRSTATVMLQNLEQKGYVVRVPVERDARLKKIVLTEKAVEQNNLIRSRIVAFNERLEEGITPQEKKEFFDILDKITENLSR